MCSPSFFTGSGSLSPDANTMTLLFSTGENEDCLLEFGNASLVRQP